MSTAIGDDAFVEDDFQYSSSPTLKSVVDKLAGEVPEISLRKTPFGVVRIPSGSHKTVSNSKGKDSEKNSTAFAFDLNVNGLPSIRQRIKVGKIILAKGGIITLHHYLWQVAMIIIPSSFGGKITLKDLKDGISIFSCDFDFILPPLARSLVELASAWLQRYKRRLVIATFIIPHRSIDGLIGTCSIRANGLEPDFECIYIDQQSKDIKIHISRQRELLTMITSIGDELAEAWSWYHLNLPIKREEKQWQILNDEKLSISQRQLDFIQQALSITSLVDALFESIRNA